MRVLLADDQQLVRAGFRSILKHEPDLEVVGEASNGAEAVRMAEELSPDVVLMDIRMPVMDGLTATRHILSRPRPPVIIVLTTFDADEFVYRALREGAAGFLLKDTSPEELVASVRAAIAGDQILSPRITRLLISSFVATPPPEDAARATAQLSEREREVMGLVAHGRSNSDIARELFIAETTVKTHVARLLQKLGLRDRVQVVVFAYEHGLVRPGE
ncbi:DNA-binding response regulator [Ornithinimicrobium avium]|uniref:DNA-binding response regulator n=1 Tax=Ornithinimicrobium avium TaxID=2283195 RepID=A0A345NT20_9MICO|nr:DNA-binding response regulator [Ornithinimicrobium avium]